MFRSLCAESLLRTVLCALTLYWGVKVLEGERGGCSDNGVLLLEGDEGNEDFFFELLLVFFFLIMSGRNSSSDE